MRTITAAMTADLERILLRRWFLCPRRCCSNNNFGRLLVVLLVWFFGNIHQWTLSLDCQSADSLLHKDPAAWKMFRSAASRSTTSSRTTRAVEERWTTANDAACRNEYHRATADRTPGWTRDDLERSRAHVGNRQRLAQFAQRLMDGNGPTVAFLNHNSNSTIHSQQQPMHVVVCGGSISMGHGVHPSTLRYADRLQEWMNRYYPIRPTSTTTTTQQQKPRQHLVTSMAAHGADICAMSKRINLLDLPTPPDLFILEFAVNDYQGQDHRIHIDHKTDVFFDGFLDLAACAETVVHKLLSDYPDAAVVFLEFQTAIWNRKTAQLLHTGVAQHYQVPVISYADALWPDLYRLAEQLRPFHYSIPFNLTSGTRDDHDESLIFPFPHGCAPCQLEHIVPQFREHGCKSLCVFAQRSGYYDRTCDVTGHACYVPFFAHDAVHPSALGHALARDLIVEAIFNAYRASSSCRRRPNGESDTSALTPFLLPPHSGWLTAGPGYHERLRARSDFVLVLDTMQVFGKQHPLLSKEHTPGFQLASHDNGLADRQGWVADAAGESVTFDIDLPIHECYAVYLSVLKSYATVGTFHVTVTDTVRQTTTPPRTWDCLWKPRISIPADVQITRDDVPECTGKCRVTVTTNPEVKDGRNGNKVKIMSLSVRKCLDKKPRKGNNFGGS